MLLRILVLLFMSSAAFANSARTVTVAAVGDIMMGTNYPQDVLPADGGSNLFKYAKEYIQAADVRLGNLEGVLFDGEKDSDGKADGANRYLFRTPTSWGRWLAEAGFNFLSLANNHARDFGAAGIESTKEVLRYHRIQYAAKTQQEIGEFNIRGIRVAVIAVDYYQGTRSITTPASTYKEIRELKKKFDIVIVSAHAGPEGKGAERTTDQSEIYLGENRGNVVAFARTAVDMGASLIVMHGPHVPRGMEIYHNKLIVYSLGNFLTSRGMNVQGMAGIAPLLRVQLAENGDFVSGHIGSFRQTREYTSTIYDKEEKALHLIQELSAKDFPSSSPQFDLRSGKFYPQMNRQRLF